MELLLLGDLYRALILKHEGFDREVISVLINAAAPPLKDFDAFLQIPAYPSRTIEMPSKSTKLVFSERDVQLAHELHRNCG